MRLLIFPYLLIALMMAPPECPGASLPSSALSRQVIARQKRVLEKALSDMKLAWGAPMHVRIFKAEKRLEVWLKHGRRFRLFKCYPICTYGAKGIGPKRRRGDGRAPEGFYRVRPGQLNPFSRYHLAFNLGYPNAFDRQNGYSGGALMVHGGCISIGCFAMTDPSMEEIYALAHTALSCGQPYFRVHIFPFEMTPRNMRRHCGSKWFDFWCNLKEGYDHFHKSRGLPPDVEVKNGRYYMR